MSYVSCVTEDDDQRRAAEDAEGCVGSSSFLSGVFSFSACFACSALYVVVARLGFDRLRGSIEYELQQLQVEPLAELVSDFGNVRDFDEAELFVQAKADGVVRGDAGHHDVQVASTCVVDDRAHQFRPESTPASTDLDVRGQLDRVLVSRPGTERSVGR